MQPQVPLNEEALAVHRAKYPGQFSAALPKQVQVYKPKPKPEPKPEGAPQPIVQDDAHARPDLDAVPEADASAENDFDENEGK